MDPNYVKQSDSYKVTLHNVWPVGSYYILAIIKKLLAVL